MMHGTRKKTRTNIFPIGLGVACLFATLNTWGGDLLKVDADNEIFFNNFENVFDATGQQKLLGTPVEPGDHLAGIINVQHIEADGTIVFFAGAENQLTGVFAQRVVAVFNPDPFDPLQVEPHIVLGAPTLTTFCDGADCFSTGLTGNEVIAIYLQTGAGTTPFESNGSMADDVAKATDGDLWLTVGHDPGADGQFGTVDDDGYIYGHTDGAFPPPDRVFAALNAIINNTGFQFAGINDINENEIGGFGLLNDVVLTSEIEFNPLRDTAGGSSPWEIRSNDPATLRPTSEQAPLACRVTGGGNDEFWDGSLVEGQMQHFRYTFGGQAGANTALPPMPSGEWQHNEHRAGRFSFHGGTASAAPGTRIVEIRCSDPENCAPARPAPAKQIDFDGIGTFSNIGKGANAPVFLVPDPMVIPEPSGKKGGPFTFHWFEVNIDDLGEPGKADENAIAACPAIGFGEKGVAVEPADCGCPDFYRITIYKGVEANDVVFLDGKIDPASLNRSTVIYQVFGYINGGNLQIHPPTGFDL